MFGLVHLSVAALPFLVMVVPPTDIHMYCILKYFKYQHPIHTTALDEPNSTFFGEFGQRHASILDILDKHT